MTHFIRDWLDQLWIEPRSAKNQACSSSHYATHSTTANYNMASHSIEMPASCLMDIPDDYCNSLSLFTTSAVSPVTQTLSGLMTSTSIGGWLSTFTAATTVSLLAAVGCSSSKGCTSGTLLAADLDRRAFKSMQELSAQNTQQQHFQVWSTMFANVLLFFVVVIFWVEAVCGNLC